MWSASRSQSLTATPFLASNIASAVPQEPAPSTATVGEGPAAILSGLVGALRGWRRRGTFLVQFLSVEGIKINRRQQQLGKSTFNH